jgi:oxygen-independent coproporphyrinogen-3 oxidase
MGLRLSEGVDADRFLRRTGRSIAESVDADTLAQAEAEDYLAWRDGRLVATPEGRLRLDALLGALLL